MLTTKEQQEEFIEKILIDFLSFLNENGYINDYDFVYETQIKKFIKQITVCIRQGRDNERHPIRLHKG